MKCCKQLSDGTLESLPFERVLATSYHDGPTDGFTECAYCHQAYSFQKIDWDDLQDLRIFAFAPLDISLDVIAGRLLPESPVRPFTLVPPTKEGDDQFVRDLFGKPSTRAAAFKGWPGTSSLWCDITGVDLSVPRDWFQYFAIK